MKILPVAGILGIPPLRTMQSVEICKAEARETKAVRSVRESMNADF
jgi:hypothetical protein